jgi:hypothetical protein
VTLTKPTGTTNGDLLIVVAYLEADTNTWASVGSGFTSATSVNNTGSFKLQVWYKWAASEPASWAWTPTSSNWRAVVCSAYSGGTGSGSPVDVSGSAQADAVIATGQTAPSVTTTAANDLLIFAYGNYSGNNPTGMSGAATNLRVAFGSVTIADATIATASATGTTWPGTGLGTETYAAIHLALLASTGGGGAAQGHMLMTGVG